MTVANSGEFKILPKGYLKNVSIHRNSGKTRLSGILVSSGKKSIWMIHLCLFCIPVTPLKIQILRQEWLAQLMPSETSWKWWRWRLDWCFHRTARNGEEQIPEGKILLLLKELLGEWNPQLTPIPFYFWSEVYAQYILIIQGPKYSGLYQFFR